MSGIALYALGLLVGYLMAQGCVFYRWMRLKGSRVR